MGFEAAINRLKSTAKRCDKVKTPTKVQDGLFIDARVYDYWMAVGSQTAPSEAGWTTCPAVFVVGSVELQSLTLAAAFLQPMRGL